MNLRNPRFWIFVFSALAVATFAVVDMGRNSPGPLATVHDREPDLEGRGGCDECHGGWRTTMTEACTHCHEDIAAHIGEKRGLHGRLGDAKVAQCARCHSEHHGAGFSIVNRASFAHAGAGAPDAFDHSLVGYAMEGKHLELECTKCHPAAADPVLEKGKRRFIGLDKNCVSCHEDPHQGRMAAACADCHGQRSFDDIRFAGHDAVLPLVGGHAAVSCRACHGKSDEHALERMGRDGDAGLSPAPRECVDCHESPHRDAFVAGVADLVTRTPGAACVACHRPEHEKFVDGSSAMTSDWHRASFFPLDVPHDAAACEDCHSPEGRDFAARYPGRGADDCRSCHRDPHGGQFDGGAAGPRACLECHEPHRFEPHAFTVDRHEETRLPLTGSHLATDCDSCHVKPNEEIPRVFHGTPARCEDCHEDAHRGFFESAAAPTAWPAAGACAECHLTTRFSELLAGGFDHGRWTSFRIEGAHAEAACESCHRPSEKPDRSGRTFGRVERHFGGVTGCDSCHPDPHGGLFDAKGRPREVDGRAGCERCHGETSFRTLESPFDHGRWTGFALDGAHGEASCGECHPTLRREDRSGRSRDRAKGGACADCHADPHAGQFLEKGRVDCRRCHESATTFEELAFNHNIESRFPLGDTHARVPCAGCHKPFVHEGVEVVRYRPVAMKCIDCHGDNLEPLRRRRAGGNR